MDWVYPELRPCDGIVEESLRGLSMDPWLSRKVSRDRRLHEHACYLDRVLPEIRKFDDSEGAFIDLGPGPGESLELVRALGRDTVGFDSCKGDGGMGDAYLAYSMWMHIRQELDVFYGATFQIPEIVSGARFISSRGSIEQILSDWMIGDPHHKHHNCKNIEWGPRFRSQLGLLLWQCRAVMRDDGIMAIHANGAKNDYLYTEALPGLAKEAGFSRIETIEPLVHRLIA